MKRLILTLVCSLSLTALYASISTPTFSVRQPFANRVDTVALTNYLGKYTFTHERLPFKAVVISIKAGKLIATTDGQSDYELTPIGDEADKFDAAGQATLYFTRDADRKVTGVKLALMGEIAEGKKES